MRNACIVTLPPKKCFSALSSICQKDTYTFSFMFSGVIFLAPDYTKHVPFGLCKNVRTVLNGMNNANSNLIIIWYSIVLLYVYPHKNPKIDFHCTGNCSPTQCGPFLSFLDAEVILSDLSEPASRL